MIRFSLGIKATIEDPAIVEETPLVIGDVVIGEESSV
jgi:carbonic anhydrase/acetyltransferase-like protein (isoleucine patch superfamily)